MSKNPLWISYRNHKATNDKTRQEAGWNDVKADGGYFEGAGWGKLASGRRAELSIHLFAAGSVVPACPLPAYLHPGKFFVIVSLDPDPNHTWLVNDLLDDFAALADDFACAEEKTVKKWLQSHKTRIVKIICNKELGKELIVMMPTNLRGSWVPENTLL